MSKSPLSMLRPGRLTSSHGDHWHSSPQCGRDEGGEEAAGGVGPGDVPGVVAGAELGVCAVLSEGLGCVVGGSVELMTEGRRERARVRGQGSPRSLRTPPRPLCQCQPTVCLRPRRELGREGSCQASGIRPNRAGVKLTAAESRGELSLCKGSLLPGL